MSERLLTYGYRICDSCESITDRSRVIVLETAPKNTTLAFCRRCCDDETVAEVSQEVSLTLQTSHVEE